MTPITPREKVLGFTALELLITMLIFSILCFSAIPQLSKLYQVYDKRNAEMQILQDLRTAQATTVEQGCRGIFVVAADNNSYSFGCDYVPFSSSSPPPFDTQLYTRKMPSNTKISTDAEIIFNSRGQVVDEQNFLTTRSVVLSSLESSGYTTFNTGTLTATGFFSYAH